MYGFRICLKSDPQEKYNLINLPEHQERIATMKNEMFRILHETNGHEIPFLEDRGRKFYNRNKNMAEQGEFPEYFYEFLDKDIFQKFDLSTGKIDLGRHSLAHGYAKQEDFTKVRALQALLVLNQIFFYL